MAKFTPGSWVVAEERPTLIRTECWHIAEVFPQAEMTDANVRLIAAAPEMYDLIRMTLEACGTATPHPSHSDLLRKVRTNARALLARIDGDDNE